MVRLTTVDGLTKRSRKDQSRFESTKEWAELKTVIDGKLKKNQAAEISFSPGAMDDMGLQSRRTIARFVQKYITEKGLGYTVQSFMHKGLHYIAVSNEAK